MSREVENMVEGYFHAWGSTERLRAETGDRSAYPQPEMAVLGGKRGSPSDPADVMLRHAEVDKRVRPRTILLATMLHVYAFGFDHKLISYRCWFYDGNHEDVPIDESRPDEVSRRVLANPQVKSFEPTYRTVRRYDFGDGYRRLLGSGFPLVRTLAQESGVSVADYGAWLVEQFAREFAESAGLKVSA